MSEQRPKPIPYPSAETEFFWYKANQDEL